MKKQLLLLAGAVIVLAALCLGIYFLNQPAAEPESSEPASLQAQDSKTVIREGKKEDIEKISVQNPDGGYVLTRGGSRGFEIETLEDASLPVDISVVETTAGNAADITMLKTAAESAENLSVYGLAPAAASAEIAYTDGETVSVKLGSAAPDNSGFYCMVNNDPAVYIIDSRFAGSLRKKTLDFISGTVLEMQEPKENPEEFLFYEKAILGGSCRDEEIVIEEADEATQQTMMSALVTTAPKVRTLNDDPILPQNGISGATAAAVFPGEKDLAGFGLDQPYSTLDVIGGSKGISFSLRISAPDESGSVFLMRDSIPVVYRIDASKLAWLDSQLQDISIELIALMHIDKISRIDVIAEKEYNFLLSGEKDELAITCGGKTLDTDIFRDYYQLLLSVPADSSYNEPLAEDAECILKYVYHFRDGSPDLTLEFYPVSDRRCAVVKNGEVDSLSRNAYIDSVLRNSENILMGEAVETVY